MKKTFLVTALGLAATFSSPASAAENGACLANWSKMDTKKVGYITMADYKDHMDMMTKAGRKTAAADRMTDKEYMDACMADVFEVGKK